MCTAAEAGVSLGDGFDIAHGSLPPLVGQSPTLGPGWVAQAGLKEALQKLRTLRGPRLLPPSCAENPSSLHSGSDGPRQYRYCQSISKPAPSVPSSERSDHRFAKRQSSVPLMPEWASAAPGPLAWVLS